MPEEDKHLHLIKAIVKNQERLEGKKVAIGRARSAPLQIDSEGEIKQYYGEGKNALDLLIQQYEEVWGQNVADKKIRNTVQKEFEPEDYSEVPERVRPEKREDSSSEGLIEKVRKIVS